MQVLRGSTRPVQVCERRPLRSFRQVPMAAASIALLSLGSFFRDVTVRVTLSLHRTTLTQALQQLPRSIRVLRARVSLAVRAGFSVGSVINVLGVWQRLKRRRGAGQ